MAGYSAASHDGKRGIDTTRANAARIYDYWLGGKDNYAVDRIAAEAITDAYPAARSGAWANRQFHQRAAAWMARTGIRQFLDIGCGLPTAENTHEVVQREAPGVRIAYVDNDPVVLAHARALLADRPGVIAVAGDVREPEAILRSRAVRELLRPGEPTGLLMTAVLHFVADTDDPWHIVQRYMTELAAGSCVAISHVSAENLGDDAADIAVKVYAHSAHLLHMRPYGEVRLLFEEAGLELVPPSEGAGGVITTCGRWLGPDVPRPAGDDISVSPGADALWCGVGKKDR